jgi:hypothetical protein
MKWLSTTQPVSDTNTIEANVQTQCQENTVPILVIYSIVQMSLHSWMLMTSYLKDTMSSFAARGADTPYQDETPSPEDEMPASPLPYRKPRLHYWSDAQERSSHRSVKCLQTETVGHHITDNVKLNTTKTQRIRNGNS